MITTLQLRHMLKRVFYETAHQIGMKITLAEATELVGRLSDYEAEQILAEAVYYGKGGDDDGQASHQK